MSSSLSLMPGGSWKEKTHVHYNKYFIQFKKYVIAQLKYVLKIMPGKGNSNKWRTMNKNKDELQGQELNEKRSLQL